MKEKQNGLSMNFFIYQVEVEFLIEDLDIVVVDLMHH
jgi:hypothetical protein